MKKIIVNCAPSGVGSGSNLGMNTVDFAIHNIVKQAGLQEKVKIFKPWPAYIKNAQGQYPSGYEFDVFPTKFEYDLHNVGGQYQKELLLYWGDFQHGEDYIRQTKRRLQQVSQRQGQIIKDSDADRIVNDYFMLNNHFQNDSIDFSIATFGTTLYQNGAKALLNSDYSNNLKWLLEKSEYSSFRDPYSAFLVNQALNNFTRSYWGSDAALLNTREELLSLDKLKPSSLDCFDGAVGFFLGRSSSNFSTRKFYGIVNKFSKKLNKNSVLIPWAQFGSGLFSKRKNLYLKFLLNNYKSVNDNIMAGDILYAMSKLSLVVTDTYHVALNSIALGIPAVCIYEAHPSQERNANMGYIESWRDKRALFYVNHNLSDLLLCSESMRDKSYVNRKIDHVCNLISDSSFMNAAYGGIHARAQVNREEISQLLKLHSTNC